MTLYILIASGIAIALAFIVLNISRKTWDIIDTPTVTPSGAIIGLCEVEGKATAALTPAGTPVNPYVSPIAGVQCHWFHLLIEKEDRDGDKSEWKIYKQTFSPTGIRISDQYGSISIDPKNASRSLEQPLSKSRKKEVITRSLEYFEHKKAGDQGDVSSLWTVSPDGYYMYHPQAGQWVLTTDIAPDKMSYFNRATGQWVALEQKSGIENVVHSITESIGAMFVSLNYRVTETVIPVDSDVFAHGYVYVTDSGTDLRLGSKPESKSTYYISTGGEKKVLKNLRLTKWSLGFLGFCLVGVVAALVNYERIVRSHSGPGPIEHKPITYVFATAGALIVILLGLIASRPLRTYNRFVRLREQVRLSRSAIDVCLGRRSTLIPQLCDVITEVAQYNQEVLTQVATLRSGNGTNAQFIALAESYPDLKSSQNFLHMQNELARTEEKIAMSRSFLNDSILAMDNLRATITGMLVSPFFAKEQRPA